MKKLSALGLATAAITVAFGITYVAGNQAAHDITYSGVVRDQKELYGDIVSGYTVDRKELQSKVDKAIHKFLRPGRSTRLYAIEIKSKEYDTMRWFKEQHHIEPFSKADAPNDLFDESHREYMIYVQSPGEMARVGQKFSTTSLAVLNPTFIAKGIRYPMTGADGKEKTLEIHRIIKDNFQFRFE